MHPQNRFWPLMQALFADPADPSDVTGDSLQSRRAFALRHHIALWDVIESCDITGASDASIRDATPNDLTPCCAMRRSLAYSPPERSRRNSIADSSNHDWPQPASPSA